MTVQPDGAQDVTVTLSDAAGLACDAGGVCTADGRRLSGAGSATVAGPGASVPDQVGRPTLSAAPTHLDASWTTPADNGSTIEGYAVQHREDGGGWVDAGHTGAAMSLRIADLAEDTAYDVRVLARNGEGDGPWSPTASARTTASDAAAEGDVRLVGGDTAREGRVEIYHGGEWGTVCDDRWSVDDAEVVCRQLGITGTATVQRRAAFGAGTGRIWMDNVRCLGDEGRLAALCVRRLGQPQLQARRGRGCDVCGGGAGRGGRVGVRPPAGVALRHGPGPRLDAVAGRLRGRGGHVGRGVGGAGGVGVRDRPFGGADAGTAGAAARDGAGELPARGDAPTAGCVVEPAGAPGGGAGAARRRPSGWTSAAPASRISGRCLRAAISRRWTCRATASRIWQRLRTWRGSRAWTCPATGSGMCRRWRG